MIESKITNSDADIEILVHIRESKDSIQIRLSVILSQIYYINTKQLNIKGTFYALRNVSQFIADTFV